MTIILEMSEFQDPFSDPFSGPCRGSPIGKHVEAYTDLYSGDRMAKPFQGLFARWFNSQGSLALLRRKHFGGQATLGFVAQSLWD